jgi:hypothetical protein
LLQLLEVHVETVLEIVEGAAHHLHSLLLGLAEEVLYLLVLPVNAINDGTLNTNSSTTLLISLLTCSLRLSNKSLVIRYTSLMSSYFGLVLLLLWSSVWSQMQAAQSYTQQLSDLISRVLRAQKFVTISLGCTLHFLLFSMFSK